ncbi:hypothetical protein GZL_01580 [Streptomyces sp. 769]|nr:hypothetical protein GZL_01580 [Streptomyces sp. 769]
MIRLDAGALPSAAGADAAVRSRITLHPVTRRRWVA